MRFRALACISCVAIAGCSPSDTAGSPVPAVSTTSQRPPSSTDVSGDPAASTPVASTPAQATLAEVAPEAGPDLRCNAADRSGVDTITVWEILGGSAARDEYESLIDDFNSSHPAFQVESVTLDGREDLLDTLLSIDPADWPDVVLAHPQATRRFFDSARIVPPGACGTEDGQRELLPAVAGAYTYEGTLQAVPFGVSTPILLFDAAEFRRAGLDPDSTPETLEELTAASKQAVSSGVSPNGLVVYDWYGTYLINHAAAQRGDLVAEPANGRAGGIVSVDYDTPVNVEAMKWLAEIVRDGGGVYIGGVPSGIEDLYKIVDPTDGAVMTIHTTGSLGDLINVLDVSFPGVELGVGPLPGASAGGLVGGNGWWMIDHEDPNRVGAADEFISWMTAPDQISRFVVATGYLPPSFDVAHHPIVAVAWAEHPQLKVGFDQIAALPEGDASSGAIFGPGVEVDYAFFDITTQVATEKLGAAEALQQLTINVNRLLSQYDAIVG